MTKTQVCHQPLVKTFSFDLLSPLFYTGGMVFAQDKRLMQKRISEVLLVSSPYDLYLMEEEGFLSDRISDEYALLHLTHAPAVTRVSTAEEALEAMEKRHFDLVVTGMRVGKAMNAFEMSRRIKQDHPEIPVALLTSETGRLATATASQRRDMRSIDKIFLWHGDTRLFIALIKLFEDRVNAEHDCLKEQVRAIILVEDSPHFYSTYLPFIYTEILEQMRALILEGTTDEEKLLRMASRPKILLASNYEEACTLYQRYHDSVLGVISDIRFPRAGVLDAEAGFAITEMVKNDNPDVPVLLQSKDLEKAYRAAAMGAEFADKNSPHLLQSLHRFITEYFGFGDFVFRLPGGGEVGRVSTMRGMERTLEDVPEAAIEYHAQRNHFSNWFFARGEFELAAGLRPMKIGDFDDIEEVRNLLISRLRSVRLGRRQTRIARFSERDFDPTTPFIRFGEGSIGGKGRGIAFMSRMLADPKTAKRFEGYRVGVPRTAAIGTDMFDRFLHRNRLYRIAMEGTDDAAIAQAFLNSELESKLVGELTAFLRRVEQPLAVRSSSLSEDSLSQPFAGLYSTYLIPNNHPDFNERLAQFLAAVKLIYASTFFANPKAYMEANNIAIEGEKMAIIIQEVVGTPHGRYFYPDMAGVAQSYNYFPVGYLKPEDGVAQLVMGLGTLVVRGERALRFSPRYPQILPQFTKARDIVAYSQRSFQALDLESANTTLFTDESATIATLELSQAEHDGVLAKVGGVYEPEDDVVYDGLSRPGKRVVSCRQVLAGSRFPLPNILLELLDIGSHGMGCPVECEFACQLGDADTPPAFSLLQIRPLVTGGEADEVRIDEVTTPECIVTTNRAMGNGVFDEITTIIAVKPQTFDLSRTSEIAQEVGRFNAEMVRRGETYILLGFGRWGTVNPLLGIPVTYAQVSHAKVIGEISTEEIHIEPSQGTHFFHNIASCRIGYLSIDTTDGDDEFVDWNWIAAQPVEMESQFVRMIRCAKPVVTRVDGRTGKGVILKPH